VVFAVSADSLFRSGAGQLDAPTTGTRGIHHIVTALGGHPAYRSAVLAAQAAAHSVSAIRATGMYVETGRPAVTCAPAARR